MHCTVNTQTLTNTRKKSTQEMQNKQTKSVTPNNLWLILNELNVKACWIFYQNIKYRLALGNMNHGKTALDGQRIAFTVVQFSDVCCLYILDVIIFGALCAYHAVLFLIFLINIPIWYEYFVLDIRQCQRSNNLHSTVNKYQVAPLMPEFTQSRTHFLPKIIKFRLRLESSIRMPMFSPPPPKKPHAKHCKSLLK